MSSSSLLSPTYISPLTPSRQRLRSIEMDQRLRSTNRNVLWIRAIAAEFTCTCLFMFIVCGCIMHAQQSRYNAGDTGLVVAFVNGFGATIMIYAFSELSGAHFNPAITFACWLAKKTSNRKLITYIVAQCVSSSLGIALLLLIFPPTDTLLNSIVIEPPPDVALWRIFLCEMLLTMILVFMVFALVVEGLNDTRSAGLTLYRSHGKSRQATAPIAIGLTVFVLCLIGGTISGGAFNPIRVFAPAIFTNRWQYTWLYWIAQFTGAALGAGLRRMFTICQQSMDEDGENIQSSNIVNVEAPQSASASNQYSPPNVHVVV